jgi:hypothetical protein
MVCGTNLVGGLPGNNPFDWDAEEKEEYRKN